MTSVSVFFLPSHMVLFLLLLSLFSSCRSLSCSFIHHLLFTCWLSCVPLSNGFWEWALSKCPLAQTAFSSFLNSDNNLLDHTLARTSKYQFAHHRPQLFHQFFYLTLLLFLTFCEIHSKINSSKHTMVSIFRMAIARRYRQRQKYSIIYV